MSNVYGTSTEEQFTQLVDIDENGQNTSTINGNLNMHNNKIINLAAGSAGSDVVNFNQLNAAVTAASHIQDNDNTTRVSTNDVNEQVTIKCDSVNVAAFLSNNVQINTTLDMGSNEILDVGTPLVSTSATNKQYVDDADTVLQNQITSNDGDITNLQNRTLDQVPVAVDVVDFNNQRTKNHTIIQFDDDLYLSANQSISVRRKSDTINAIPVEFTDFHQSGSGVPIFRLMGDQTWATPTANRIGIIFNSDYIYFGTPQFLGMDSYQQAVNNLPTELYNKQVFGGAEFNRINIFPTPGFQYNYKLFYDSAKSFTSDQDIISKKYADDLVAALSQNRIEDTDDQGTSITCQTTEEIDYVVNNNAIMKTVQNGHHFLQYPVSFFDSTNTTESAAIEHTTSNFGITIKNNIGGMVLQNETTTTNDNFQLIIQNNKNTAPVGIPETAQLVCKFGDAAFNPEQLFGAGLFWDTNAFGSGYTENVGGMLNIVDTSLNPAFPFMISHFDLNGFTLSKYMVFNDSLFSSHNVSYNKLRYDDESTKTFDNDSDIVSKKYVDDTAGAIIPTKIQNGTSSVDIPTINDAINLNVGGSLKQQVSALSNKFLTDLELNGSFIDLPNDIVTFRDSGAQVLMNVADAANGGIFINQNMNMDSNNISNIVELSRGTSNITFDSLNGPISIDVAATPVLSVSASGLDLNSKQITSLADPSLAQDAATKNYVDTLTKPKIQSTDTTNYVQCSDASPNISIATNNIINMQMNDTATTFTHDITTLVDQTVSAPVDQNYVTKKYADANYSGGGGGAPNYITLTYSGTGAGTYIDASNTVVKHTDLTDGVDFVRNAGNTINDGITINLNCLAVVSQCSQRVNTANAQIFQNAVAETQQFQVFIGSGANSVSAQSVFPITSGDKIQFRGTDSSQSCHISFQLFT